jgi:serine protease Do
MLRRNIMRSLLVLCLVVLAGCQNGFSSFYHPNFDPKKLPPGLATSDLKYLDQNETPQVFTSDDISRDVKIARSKYWLPIGYSSFNGAMGTQDQLVSEAKELGAAMVLVTSKFTENRTITTPLFIPNNQTTYYNGTTNGQIYGNNGNSANYNSNTTGTATTYGTTVVPLTSVQARYDQAAVYFVRYTKKFKFGIATVPLTPELRAQYERNTGALVEIVFENTPAFNANILPGDIITELDGKAVENSMEFNKVFLEVHPANGLLPVKILRNGIEKTINVQLAP